MPGSEPTAVRGCAGRPRPGDAGRPSTGTGRTRLREHGGDGGRWQDGRAVALEGERGDEAESVDLRGRQQGDPDRADGRVELVAEGGSRQREEELEIGQVLDGERTARRGDCVLLGRHEHQVLLEERARDEIPPGHREVEDRQIELPGGQLGLEPGRVALDDDEAEPRMSLACGVHQAGDQPPGCRPDHPDPHRPGDLVPARRDVGHQSVDFGEDPPCTGDDRQSFLGQPSVGTVDHRRPELPFETGHVGGHVGLDRAQVFGRRREGAVVTDRGECLQVPQFHRSK